CGMGVVVCGDGHQMLYRFRGAVDALDAPWLADAEVHYLTQSFRFGPAAAHVANVILHFKGERRQLAGLGQPTRIAKALPTDLEHRTILCRTVVGVIEAALAEVEAGAKIFWVGAGSPHPFVGDSLKPLALIAPQIRRRSVRPGLAILVYRVVDVLFRQASTGTGRWPKEA
ncbi:hypothetical protein SAMN04244572_02638, partial [Azotobacter beijerinckii]